MTETRSRIEGIVTLALVLTLVACATHAGRPSIDMLAWLEGDWVRDTRRGRAVESWNRVSENTLEGIVTVTSGDVTQVTEYLRIERFGEELFYAAKPGQNEYPTSFKLIEWDENRWVFENPNHDFPQRIIYVRGEGGRLSVRIESMDEPPDGEESGIDFQFTRAD